MEPSTDFEFRVDEQYENEKGIFTVLSIHKQEMVIQWENGEKIGTDIDFQRRIQERRLRETSEQKTNGKANKGKSRKTTALRVRPQFEGLQPGDFKDNAAKTNWRNRSQLGGAVTTRLLTDRFSFNSWAFAQKSELHWADVEHRIVDSAAYQARFFVKLDELSMIYGFCVTRPDDQTVSSKDWEFFMSWLRQSENDRMLQGLATDHNLAVYGIGGSEEVVLLPSDDGWRVESGDGQQKVDMLATHVDSLSSSERVDLMIARRTSKEDVLSRGQEIADDIATLFALLMPLYRASVT